MGALRGLYSLALSETPWKLISQCRLKSRFLVNTTRCSFHISSIVSKRRKTAEERKAPRIIEYSPKAKLKPVVDIWKNMTVEDLATTMNKDIDHIFELFMYVDNSVSYDSANAIIDNMQVIQDAIKKSGFKYRIIAPPSNKDTDEKRIKDISRRPPADLSKLRPRPPVVTIMGHVDHGKTTLLDSLRNTKVVDSEFGGITQHIGAFSVRLPGSAESITFLDTPGHAAFTAMRARGADATDIVVLVVAADDGVMEQTVESIRMAREAQVPIIVAINKIDKPGADIARTREMLLSQGLQLEETGGDVQSVPISALAGTNLPQLVEAIALQAELMELKAEPTGLVEGLVIESSTDARRGKLSTALVQRGTLRRGSVLVSGVAWAKVRAMFDDAGHPVTEAPPSTPVEILGWRELPEAGDDVLEVESEKVAHDIVKYRESMLLQKKQEDDHEVVLVKAAEHQKVYRAQLEAKRKMGRYKLKRVGPREKEIKDDDTGPNFNVIVKGDVGGSLEAILDVLETYDDHKNCKLSIVHYGVGNVSENDIELAQAFKGVIYCFNVETPSNIKHLAKTKNVTVKPHNVIYRMVDDIKEEISQRLPPKQVEEVLGEANVLQHFEVTEGKKKVAIAGSRCTKGSIKKGSKVRLIRKQEVFFEGTISILRHLKAEVDSIKKDVECGVRLNDNNLEFEPGDVLQCFVHKEVAQKCEWDPGF